MKNARVLNVFSLIFNAAIVGVVAFLFATFLLKEMPSTLFYFADLFDRAVIQAHADDRNKRLAGYVVPAVDTLIIRVFLQDLVTEPDGNFRFICAALLIGGKKASRYLRIADIIILLRNDKHIGSIRRAGAYEIVSLTCMQQNRRVEKVLCDGRIFAVGKDIFIMCRCIRDPAACFDVIVFR